MERSARATAPPRPEPSATAREDERDRERRHRQERLVAEAQRQDEDRVFLREDRALRLQREAHDWRLVREREAQREREFQHLLEVTEGKARDLFHSLHQMVKDEALAPQYRLGAAREAREVLDYMQGWAGGRRGPHGFQGWDDDDDA